MSKPTRLKSAILRSSDHETRAEKAHRDQRGLHSADGVGRCLGGGCVADRSTCWATRIPESRNACGALEDGPGRLAERAHRGGKTVIVIDDFATHLPGSVIESVAKKVRAACGCGGTVKGRQVEIQGDQPVKVRAALEAEGFQVAGVK